MVQDLCLKFFPLKPKLVIPYDIGASMVQDLPEDFPAEIKVKGVAGSANKERS